jgi:DNA-binding XRE family transcriptional regulator
MWRYTVMSLYNEELRVERLRRRLTQVDAAKLIGIYRTTLNEIEMGRVPIAREVLESYTRKMDGGK